MSLVCFDSTLTLFLLSSEGNTAAVQRSDNGDSLRFLIMEGDYSNVGFVYKQLVSQLPLTTQHIYVYPLKASSILSHMKDGLTCRFSINVIGINPLSQFIKKLCHAAGVEDWKSKTPHMMRAFVCTTLANDSSVNSNEVARTLRHKSIASQQAYIGMTTQSEMSRNTAILGKSTMDALVANKPIEEEDRKLTVEEMQALNATDTKTAAISVDEERKKKRKKKKKKQKKKIR